MSRFFALIATLLTALLAAAPDALARSHVALVIDNAETPATPAAATRAQEIVRSLERMSYVVTHANGADAASLRRLLGQFRTSTEGAEVALFYFSGPALSVAGRNLLVGRGAAPERAIEEQAVPVAEIEAGMKASKANVVVLEAGDQVARLAEIVRQRPDRSLALSPISPRPGFLFASAAPPGRFHAAKPGVFTEALAAELANRDFNWGTLAANLRWQTFQRSHGAQVPLILSGLSGPVRVAAAGGDLPLPTLPGRALSAAERERLIAEVQRELKARQCHEAEPNGDANAAAGGLAALGKVRKDAPRLDVASATRDDYEAWLKWLRGTEGRLCPPAAPVPAVVPPPARQKKAPVATPQREEPPARQQRASPPPEPKQRRVERAEPAPRRSPPPSPPVVRRESSGGGGGARSGGGGGGGGPTIRVPSF
jgi:hypothetical protein